MMFRWIFTFSIIFLTACTSWNPLLSPQNPESVKLNNLITQYTEANKRQDPYYAHYYNVEEDLDKFGDFLSPDYRARQKKLAVDHLENLKAIQFDKLPANDAIAYRLFKSDLEKDLRGLDFPYEYFSFNQMGSRLRDYIDDSSPQLSRFPFDSVEHYQAFIKRSEGFPAYVDRQILALREGAQKGYALNCTIAKNALSTYKEALETNLEKNPFYRPTLQFPNSFSEEDRKKISDDFKTMIEHRILPGFQKFDQFYRKEYLPKCRQTYGVKSLPQGRELYLYRIEKSTDLKIEPQEIHAIGLAEVARIRSELTEAFRAIGYKGSLRDSMIKITKDPKTYFSDVNDMFAAYASFRSKVEAEIAKSFSLTPQSDFKIVEGENPEDTAGSYVSPTDYIPYGRFVVNSMNLKATPRWGVNTLFLHEAIPGHHFHLALQYEMKDQLSEYQRKMFSSNAFTEGWALYAERWGREVGLVSDPYQMIGSLSDEMLRAVRLVVDTGIHHYGWSRQKVLSYMRENLPSDERDIQIEADRYSVWPGQALGYKMGQLKILELRSYAQKELGPRFDLKEFHNKVIGSGTLSLPILEDKVRAWVISVKK